MKMVQNVGRASSILLSLSACALAQAAGLSTTLREQRLPQSKLPAWLPEVLDARFDAAFQDRRTNESIQRDIALLLAEPAFTVAGTGDPNDRGPLAACFAEGTVITPELMDAVNAAIAGSFQTRYQLDTRWSPGSSGQPYTLSWSFVPDGLSIPSGVGEPTANSELFSRLDSQFGAANRAVWIAQFTNVFARWSALSGLNYTRVTASGVDWDSGAAWGTAGNDTTLGDVRIAMKNIDGVNGILAYNSFPQGGDMVIDRSESWNSGAPNYVFFRNTLAHEHGHGIGLRHVCPIANNKLMEPFLSTAFNGPQQDDIRAAHRHYGDAFEPNNDGASAVDLGTLALGSTTTIGTVSSPTVLNSSTASISVNSDLDFYKFNVGTEPRLVTFNLRPIGNSYVDAPQTSACDQTTPTTNALSQGNLVLSYIDAGGVTVQATINNNGAGVNETYTGLLLPPGNSFARASITGTLTAGTQLYQLDITINNVAIAPTASDNTFNDFVRVTTPIIPNASLYRVFRNTTNLITGSTQVGTMTPPTTTFDDTSAVPGTQYYYFIAVEQTGVNGFRITTTNTGGNPGSRPFLGPVCDSIDFNQDTLFPDSGDLDDFIAVLSGGPSACSTFPTPGCNDLDFNNDGLFPDSADLDAFVSRLGGGPCF